MMVSVGALLYSAVTYYKHEPWEEYLTLIGNIELSAGRLMDLSLSNYTQTLDTNILKTNLGQWQSDLTKTYSGRGVALTYSLASGTAHNYSLGLAYDWYKVASFSAANATFSLNISSAGLTGYKFIGTAFLNLTILNIDSGSKEINATVTRQDGTPVTGLTKDNFQVDGYTITSVTTRHDQEYVLVYTIKCASLPPSNTTVRVWDQRGIHVVARKA